MLDQLSKRHSAGFYIGLIQVEGNGGDVANLLG